MLTSVSRSKIRFEADGLVWIELTNQQQFRARFCKGSRRREADWSETTKTDNDRDRTEAGRVVRQPDGDR